MNRCISTYLQYAVTIHKIKYNPVEDIIYPKDNEIIEAKDNYISEEEQKRLIEALKGDVSEGIILIGLACGLRLVEAMAIDEPDINFNTRMVKINKSVKYVWTGKWNSDNKKIYEYKLTIPKTKSSTREVPFPSMLVPILKSIIRTNKENKL